MKKIAMYRRGRDGCANAGLKEKIMWQLSKEPMTGQQLAQILKVSIRTIHDNLSDSVLLNQKVATVTAGEWFSNESGVRDRVYTAPRNPKRVAVKNKTIVISNRSFSQVGEENRQKNIIAAQRRARLIAAGLYITEL